MKNRQMLLVAVALIAANGAVASARADSDKKSVTLFTPRDRGDHLICGAVNVSGKTLGMAFAILGDDGNPVCPACNSAGTGNPTSEAPVLPGTVGEIDLQLALGSPEDAYCEVEVSGTDDPNDVRVGLGTTLTRTIPGTNPPVPVFVTRAVEGH
jgi:hypothetical protein